MVRAAKVVATATAQGPLRRGFAFVTWLSGLLVTSPWIKAARDGRVLNAPSHVPGPKEPS